MFSRDPYSGKAISISELPETIDYRKAEVVIVTGDSWNNCGHMLLALNDRVTGRDHYFQVGPSFRSYPHYLSHYDYLTYLRVKGKIALARRYFTIPNPESLRDALIDTLDDKIFWKILWDNCAVFVEKLLAAGGVRHHFIYNCPEASIGRAEKFKQLSSFFPSFRGDMKMEFEMLLQPKTKSLNDPMYSKSILINKLKDEIPSEYRAKN